MNWVQYFYINQSMHELGTVLQPINAWLRGGAIHQPINVWTGYSTSTNQCLKNSIKWFHGIVPYSAVSFLDTLYLSFYQKDCKTWHGLLRAFAALYIVTFGCGTLNVLRSLIIHLFLCVMILVGIYSLLLILASVISDDWAYIACCSTYYRLFAVSKLNILTSFFYSLPAKYFI